MKKRGNKLILLQHPTAVTFSRGDRSLHIHARCWCVHQEASPGAVGHLHADAVAVLASALGGGVIAGSRPTQAGAGSAPSAVAVCAHGPAGPSAEAPVHGHVSYLRAAGGGGEEGKGISG